MQAPHVRRIDLSQLHPGQVIPFATHSEQKRLIGSWSSHERISYYFSRLDPKDVQPTAAAERRSEYLLVARGFVPENLFLAPPRRRRSVH